MIKISDDPLDLLSIHRFYENSNPYQRIGKVCGSRGSVYRINLSKATIGSCVEFVTEEGDKAEGEVIAIDNNQCLAMPYNNIIGINSETKVYLKNQTSIVSISEEIIGRIIDFKCEPIDGKGPIKGEHSSIRIFSDPINPMHREKISQPIETGINVVDFFCTVGKGQRISIMAGSGVGKSVMLGMMARNTNSDVNVIALIGERGREVLEFVNDDLSKEGLKKSVIIVATSDESPLIRTKLVYTAKAIAEYFRDMGKDVLFMMDSITRFAIAQREISLNAGEPPGQKGYTPSVFSSLPKILERDGIKKDSGSITGLYTVLVEGNDFDEPISDAIRAISDGHILLSRELANKNHFPSVDILESLSRLMDKIVSKEHMVVVSYVRDLLSKYRSNEEVISIGAYVKGSNIELDKAIEINKEINNIFRQDRINGKSYSLKDLFNIVVEILKKVEEKYKEE